MKPLDKVLTSGKVSGLMETLASSVTMGVRNYIHPDLDEETADELFEILLDVVGDALKAAYTDWEEEFETSERTRKGGKEQ